MRGLRVVHPLIIIALLGLTVGCSNDLQPKQSCDTTPLTLNVGDVRPALSGGCVYISGGTSGGEYALVPFNTDTVYADIASLRFSSTGAATVTTPLQSRRRDNWSVPAPNHFETQLRTSESRLLTPLIAPARRWYSTRTAGTATTGLRPSFSASASNWVVGDTVTFNVKTGTTFADACQTPDIRTGVVVAITNTAIVVADTANPAGGYTSADYLKFATQFDSVYTMDTNAFGTPSDIDNNGHVILFFTRAVNELSPAGSGSVVGGFFYARDLFPKQNSPVLGAGSGCPTSNVAEMFYLLVPDPNGVVNGNIRPKIYVSSVTISTTAHEFQHLINASRRIYVNTTATGFEVVWLNEGLSHIAEELLFYQQSSGLAPRMDIDSTAFIGNLTNINAYNYDQSANFGRFETYLLQPSSSSPYAPNDSLQTRGATWSFLRYAADHRGTSDGNTFYQLVNSTTAGIANLQNVFGSGLSIMFRDWAIAAIADDVPGAAAEWQHPSWDFRGIYDYISSTKSYPLATVTVGDGSPQSVSLNGGSAAYVRFTIQAGQTADLQWTSPPSATVVTLVRLK